jgi:sigma-54 dependent transcriptional regulator, acetoin dehydrogenase operon transcriptional activator AcoR
MMHGHEAWRRTRDIRERYLAAGDPERLPPPDCGVRREIVMSWRRSLLSGVDTAGTDLPRDSGAVPPARLVEAARPVLDRLASQIAGTQAWAFLADRECRLVSYVVGDAALTPLLEERGAFPGARFGEDVVGTNGLGTAVEQQRPFIVAGSEHYRAYESEATTAGAPVRDPLTRRLIGLLNMNCHYDRTSEMMLPLITELARDIEERLMAACPAGQDLLEEIARMWTRRSQAVVVLSDEVFVANAPALTLLGGADHQLLRDWARDAVAAGRERTARLELGPDLRVTARCRPADGPSRQFAAVVTLTAAPPAPAGGNGFTPARSSVWQRLRGQVEEAAAAGLPVLLRGEPGTGKMTLARAIGGPADPRPVTLADCALAAAHPRAWAEELATALADPEATVVLRHLDILDAALARTVAGLTDSARARLAATATAVTASTGGAAAGAAEADAAAAYAALAGRFPVVVDVPALRDRAADIPALITEIIAELRPGQSRPRCTAEALAALAASQWPGNVRQLRQIVTTALVRSMSCDITIDDLPAGYPGAARGRQLTGLERAERQALLTALRDAAGDREAAARDLGISRATIYRKLRRLGIREPAGLCQQEGGAS